MKIILSVISLFLLIGCKRQEELAETKINLNSNEFIITKGSVGGLSPGHSITTSLPMGWSFEKKTLVLYNDEGSEYEAIVFDVVNQNNEILLRCDPEYDLKTDSYSLSTIGNITVLSDTFKTEKGIGVGSSIKSFMDAYPDSEFRYFVESFHLFAETDSINGIFSFPYTSLRDDADIGNDIGFHEYIIKGNDLNLEAKIESITINFKDEAVGELELESPIDEIAAKTDLDISKYLGKTTTEIRHDFKNSEINYPGNYLIAFRIDNEIHTFIYDENGVCIMIWIYKDKSQLSQTIAELKRIYPYKSSGEMKFWNNEVEVEIQNKSNLNKIIVHYGKNFNNNTSL